MKSGEKICPFCTKENPADAMKCIHKCGYAFEGYQEKSSPPTIQSTTKSNKYGMPIESQNVVITDIKMEFISMVEFMVKWAIASIPAFIILLIIGFVMFALFFGTTAIFK